MNRIKKGFIRAMNVYSIHGFLPFVSLYASKVLGNLGQRPNLRLAVKVKIQGSWMYLNALDPGISRSLLTDGVREANHVKQVRENLKPGMTGIELGANIGYYALIEAGQIGSTGKIYAIEPEKGNIDLLKKNVSANGLDNIVSIHQYIIGDSDGEGQLNKSAFSNRHSMSTANRYGVPGTGQAEAVPVPMVKLDTFMDYNNLQPEEIDFVRMDIEGYEVVVFQGMHKLLSAKTPLKLFIEFHPGWYGEWGWTFERLVDYLYSFGLEAKSISYKSKEGTTMINNPSREQVLLSERLSLSTNGGSHAYLERV